MRKQKLCRDELTNLAERVWSAVLDLPFSAVQHEGRRSKDFWLRAGVDSFICLQPVVQVKTRQKGGLRTRFSNVFDYLLKGVVVCLRW